MNGERLKPHTDSLFVEGMRPTGFGREFEVDPQAVVDREMRHMMGTNQRGEREHRGAGRRQIREFRNKNNYEQQLYVWKARDERYSLNFIHKATRTTTNQGVRDELHFIRGMVLKGVC
nr:hypothetical protein [Tanacetum cinerariifolium]